MLIGTNATILDMAAILNIILLHSNNSEPLIGMINYNVNIHPQPNPLDMNLRYLQCSKGARDHLHDILKLWLCFSSISSGSIH